MLSCLTILIKALRTAKFENKGQLLFIRNLLIIFLTHFHPPPDTEKVITNSYFNIYYITFIVILVCIYYCTAQIPTPIKKQATKITHVSNYKTWLNYSNSGPLV